MPSECFDDRDDLRAATPVTVTGGRTVTADARLDAPDRIVGTVTGPSGPLAKVRPVARYADCPARRNCVIGDATPDASGTYAVAVRPGRYTICFVPYWGEPLVAECWNDRSEGAGDVITVRSGRPAVAAAVLAAAGGISGKVVGPTGRPVAGASVFVSGPNAVQTDANGVFERTDLTPGRHRVCATPPEGDTALAPGCWRDRADRAGAGGDAVVVTGGRRAGPLTIQLDRVGALAGRVTGPGGTPVVAAGVQVAPVHGGRAHLDRAVPVQTDGEGRYRVGELESGRYRLCVTAPVGSTLARVPP